MYKEKQVTEYRIPAQVAKKEKARNESVLFGPFLNQHVLYTKDDLVLESGGAIVLDFGKEYFGGVRIFTSSFPKPNDGPNLRIRFGESLSESSSEISPNGATNDHAIRDLTTYVPPYSDFKFGTTGYRYIRIDNVSSYPIAISRIYGIYIHTPNKRLFRFRSNDEKLNVLVETAARTLSLCLHNYLWDGAKRDQHVWAGDLYPEILSALLLYKNPYEVKNSLDLIIRYSPKDTWINGLPSYNIYFLLCLNEYIKRSGHRSKLYFDWIDDNLDILEKCLTEEGKIDFTRAHLNYGLLFFLDWQTVHTKDAELGCYYLLGFVLRTMEEAPFYSKETKEKIARMRNKLTFEEYSPKFKSVMSLKLLNGLGDKEELIQGILDKNAEGYSTFLSYFIGEALVRNGCSFQAYQDLRQYYQAMVDLGATTFFEYFDMDWAKESSRIDEEASQGKLDFHRDHGRDCFASYRHSLCHGWSTSILPFVCENILGIRFLSDNKVSFHPNLMDLKEADAEIPSPKGILKIHLTPGKKELSLPKGMELERDL